MKLLELINGYNSLSAKDQQEFLRKTSQKTSISIADFATKYQQSFGSNIEFSNAVTSGPDHNPEVKITLITKRGDFTGKGKNQKEAKLKAVIKASKEIF